MADLRSDIVVSVVKGRSPLVLKVTSRVSSVFASVLSPLDLIESTTALDGIVAAEDDSESIVLLSCWHGICSHASGDVATFVESVDSSV